MMAKCFILMEWSGNRNVWSSWLGLLDLLWLMNRDSDSPWHQINVRRTLCKSCIYFTYFFCVCWQQVFMPSGRMLGGSDSFSNMIYARGNPEDYDVWASMGATGWSYEDVLPYFIKSENNKNSFFKTSRELANYIFYLTIQVLCPAQQKIGHFGDVLPSSLLAWYWRVVYLLLVICSNSSLWQYLLIYF